MHVGIVRQANNNPAASLCRLMFEVATVKKYMANVHEVSFPEVPGSTVSHYFRVEDPHKSRTLWMLRPWLDQWILMTIQSFSVPSRTGSRRPLHLQV